MRLIMYGQNVKDFGRAIKKTTGVVGHGGGQSGLVFTIRESVIVISYTLMQLCCDTPKCPNPPRCIKCITYLFRRRS